MTTSREDEEEETNQPSKKLEPDNDGLLNESCFGHQTLHLLPIFMNMILPIS